MKKIYNKFGYGSKVGGCLLACLESLLEQPLNLVNFHLLMSQDEKDWDWLETVNEDLKDEVNYKLVKIYKPKKRKYIIHYYNVNGFVHVVIGQDGKIIHDPSSHTLIYIEDPNEKDVEGFKEFWNKLEDVSLEPISYFELVKLK